MTENALSPAPTRTRPFVLEGMVLTAGALGWAVSVALHGLDPETGTWEGSLHHGVGFVFQAGLLALLSVLWRTDALGTGRLARFFLGLEAVLVVLATISTIGDALDVADSDQVWWAVFDTAWPLSMLGMFLIGIRIAVHGRWRGAYRWWPLVAESWLPVTILAMNLGGDGFARVVSAGHVVVGYAVLGQLVARKEA